MTAANLLRQLEAEGITVALNLKLEADVKPSDETLSLIRENRASLLTHLAKRRALPELGDDAVMFAKVLEIFPPTGPIEWTPAESKKAEVAA